MADAVFTVSAALLRNLADKLYEKRKSAALELEGIVKSLCIAGDHEKVTALVKLLTREFTQSPQSNHRKGGLIGLAAVTVGLAGEASRHLDRIVPPVLNSFCDQDSRVRYYACEALYNIAKVVRGEFILFFNQIFDALCKLSADSDANVQSAAHLLDRLVKDIVTESDQFRIEEFIPLLHERMTVVNPFVRQFLVGWITVLDSVPEIDMLGFLPDFLEGLFAMLSDSGFEIRQQADCALKEFLQEIKNSKNVDYGRMVEILVKKARQADEYTRLTAVTWINDFLTLDKENLVLVEYYADILGAILPSIADKEPKIRQAADEINEKLRSACAGSLKKRSDGFRLDSVLNVARRSLSSELETTRIKGLQWMFTLFDHYYSQVIVFLNEIFESLLDVLSDPSDKVVLLVLDVLACIARDDPYFHKLVLYLIHNFFADKSLLEKRGSLIIRRLCVLLNAERIYKEFAAVLEEETNYNFAATMVQVLNLILLTSSELADIRYILNQSLGDSSSRKLFVSLYPSWCHSPMATISLCLLTQAYHHASSVIQSLREDNLNLKFLVQIDKLVHLLESPIFAYLRLQLLEPAQYPWLIKSLYGLLMLLPQQSSAFKVLRTRLKTVPSYSCANEVRQISSGISYQHTPQLNEDANFFASKLHTFHQVQLQHEIQARKLLQSHFQTTSFTLSKET
ncbi:VAC14-like protein [Zostera marina]|uniref:VAC14-like protein n=1 Tax=Zostera marina TaxID=29655 RepID=A0A0K9PL02_ZOSMR|nr:VAC14-like protein [Zostera marina]